MDTLIDLLEHLGKTYLIAILLVIVLLSCAFAYEELTGITAWVYEVYPDGIVNGPAGPKLKGDFPVREDGRICFIYEDGDMSNPKKCPSAVRTYLLFTRLGILYKDPLSKCEDDGIMYPCIDFPSIPGQIEKPHYIWEFWK